MGTTIIRVNALTKSYKLYEQPADRLKESLHPLRREYHRVFHALREVSFTVDKGEVVGIIGKNGSGKSTLLKMITGVLTPSSGTVEVNGKVSALLELGAGFNPEMSGIENIYMNGMLMGYSRDEMSLKLDDIVAFADIGEFIHQPVKMYSSGMFARLAFAVAINVEPEVLIVDEALSVGDAGFQAKCYRKFNEFQEQGKTILFVTHSMDTIIKYCTRAIVLDGGRMLEEGAPRAMVDVYKKLLSDCYYEEVAPTVAGQEGAGGGRTDAMPNAAANTASNAAPSDTSGDTCSATPTPAPKAISTVFRPNPSLMEYGTKEAEIIDYGVFDEAGRPALHLVSDETHVVKMTVRFHKTVHDPIFAFAIKDLKGNELCGTNTLIGGVEVGTCEAGSEVSICFTQAFHLNAGVYTLSLGCTKMMEDKLNIFHRLYDVLILEMMSHRQIFGIYDVGSVIRLSRGGQ